MINKTVIWVLMFCKVPLFCHLYSASSLSCQLLFQPFYVLLYPGRWRGRWRCYIQKENTQDQVRQETRWHHQSCSQSWGREEETSGWKTKKGLFGVFSRLLQSYLESVWKKLQKVECWLLKIGKPCSCSFCVFAMVMQFLQIWAEQDVQLKIRLDRGNCKWEWQTVYRLKGCQSSALRQNSTFFQTFSFLKKDFLLFFKKKSLGKKSWSPTPPLSGEFIELR